MPHFFRSIYFTFVTLSVSYNSCVAMDDTVSAERGLLRRSTSSAVALNEKGNDSRYNHGNEERTQTVPECCCVQIILDYLLYRLGYNNYKYEK